MGVASKEESDLWKLERDFDFKVREIIRQGMVDLSLLGNQVLSTNEKWSLDNLVRHLLHRCLDKDPAGRKGDWDDWSMTDVMRKYAATDAYASLLVYNELQKRALKAS
ncbi:unnamed protein product [Owenia fusiformis]|nr:unnamed protein product [Owenia fusiformis]